MSEVKRFHKKEAAKILVELRNKTEDERLMDYRRQLLNKDNNMDANQREFQERLEQACWPWPYPNMTLPPYNTIPIGYPTWPPNPPFWFPNSPSYMPETATAPYMPTQAFPGMDYHSINNFPWPMFPHQPAYVDSRPCNRRRRTKFTDEQLAVLEKTFKNGSKFPSPGERMRLETKTGLSKDKISVWFQNRRAKEKREKGQDGGSKESTTTDSELETEDEKQLSISEETPEDDSEIEDTRNIQNRTAADFQLTTSGNQSANTHAFKLPYSEGQSNIVSDVKQPHDKNIHEITSTGIKLSECQGETSTLGSSGLYHNEVQDARNHPSNAPSVSSIQTQHPEVDINTPFHIKHVQHGHISAHSPTAQTISMTSSDLCCNERIEETRNHQDNSTSVTNLEHPTNVCKNTPTRLVYTSHSASPARQSESSEPYRNDTEPIRNYQNIPSDIKSSVQEATGSVVKEQHPEWIKAVDSSKSYHNEIEDTQKDQNNTRSNIEVTHSERQSNIPSYMVLTLPCGTIAVESTELYRRKMEDTQKYENIASDNLHAKSVLTSTPTEVKVSYAGGTAAVDVSGIYRGEFEDTESSENNNTVQGVKILHTEVQDNAARDTMLPYSASTPTNTHNEIKISHPDRAVAVELKGLYFNENDNVSSFLPPEQLSTSFDEMPRNRVISETIGTDKIPDAMATLVSGNDVITSIKENIDNAEDSGRGDGDVFYNKKVNTKEDIMNVQKTEEDMLM